MRTRKEQRIWRRAAEVARFRRKQLDRLIRSRKQMERYCPFAQGNCQSRCVHYDGGYTHGSFFIPAHCKLWGSK